MTGHRPINEDLREKFETAWIAGTPPKLVEYLPAEDDVEYVGTLEELVIIELEMQWKQFKLLDDDGTVYVPDKIEQYLTRFAQLHDPEILLNLLQQEFAIRRASGDDPNIEEYMDRFPAIITSSKLLDADAPEIEYRPPLKRSEIGSYIGNYELLDEIGEGGMGSVYLAHQRKPVDRRVALKVIKRGMNSKDIIARFEAERQAVAMMDHENIARILDAGTTNDGQPFFVMELVSGIPITEFCDHHKLSVRRRMELFVNVCSAIQHAHQKGIIHRDLKPSNILVTVKDGKYVPKVIDFGLAKALESQKLLTDKTMETQIGQVMGTLKYMSPEQAAADHFDIDTRTDIYALGIILYELLTGSTPFDQGIKNGALIKVLEIIREEEPIRPSAKLSTLNETATKVSQQRQTDPSRLTYLLRGELDWVVLKAIAKDRRLRYETASSFAEDIQRYLNNDPVLARPPSLSYRLRKTFHKHRLAISAAIAIAILLIAGIIGTTLGMVRANQATERAIAAKNDADLARRKETAARKLAEEKRIEAGRQRDKAEREKEAAIKARNREKKVFDFMVESFESPDPALQGRDLRASTLVKLLFDRLRGEFSDQPANKAILLTAYAKLMRNVGLYDKSIVAAEEALKIKSANLGPYHVETLQLRNLIGMNQFNLANLEAAEKIHREVYEIQKQHLGEKHYDTLASLNNLAMCYAERGDYNTAIKMLMQHLRISVLRYGPLDQNVMISISNLGVAYEGIGQLDLALKHYERAEFLQRTFVGKDHPSTLLAAGNAAGILLKQGQHEQAVKKFRYVLDRKRKVLGPSHPETFRAIGRWAGALEKARKWSVAYDEYKSAFQQCKNAHGADAICTLELMEGAARYERRYHRIRYAIPMYRELIERTEKVLTPNHPVALSRRHELGVCYQHFKKWDEALAVYYDTLEKREQTLSKNHVDTIATLINLAYCLSNSGNHKQALKKYDDLINRQETVFTKQSWQYGQALGLKASAFRRYKKYPEALALRKQSVEIYKQHFGPEQKATLSEMHLLALAQQRAGFLDKAFETHGEVLQLREKNLGKKHVDTLKTINEIGKLLLKQKKYSSAIEQFKTLVARSKRNDDYNGPEIDALHWLASAYRQSGNRQKQIETLLKRIDAIETSQFERRKLGDAIDELAVVYRKANELDKAVDIHRRNLNYRQLRYSTDSDDTLLSMSHLALALRTRGDYDEAFELQSKRQAILAKKWGKEHKKTVSAYNTVIGYAIAASKFQVTIDWIDDRFKLAANSETLKVTNPGTLNCYSAVSYLAIGNLEKASEYAAASIEVFSNHKNPNQRTFNLAKHVLACTEKSPAKFEQAEKQINDSYQVLLADFKRDKLSLVDNWMLARSIEQAISFFQRIQKPEKVKFWQNKKSKFQLLLKEKRKTKLPAK